MPAPAPAARKPVGITFPINESGERSTTDAQKKVWAATFHAVNSPTALKVEQEKKWRYTYQKYVNEHVKESLASPEKALASAEAGLAALHNSFEFIRGDESMSLAEAMKTFKGTFETLEIKGQGKRPENGFDLEVPYKGRTLKGAALLKQLEQWKNYGTIEPSAAEAIANVVNNRKWVDLSDQYFVLLGAGSAMGPLLVLLALGANVIAVDLNRPGIWKRLIGLARASCGTLTFPVRKPAQGLDGDELFENAGCDLIAEVPEINNWLQGVHPDKDLTVGCYVYLDGEAHVRVVLACDAILKGLCDSRKSSIAFLCTPTDTHVIPEEARQAALQNFHSKRLGNLLMAPVKALFGRKVLHKNVQPQVKADGGRVFSYVDGLVVAQGPNYALAKRMQHWRSIVARSQGCLVSTNIAPSTATVSVTSNRQFAWAYDGMPFFPPLEIFQQETSNAVMSALLINDVRNPDSIANPARHLDNPLELFSENSFHGGVWRCGYTVGSVGEISVLVHFVKVALPFLPVLLVLVALAVYYLLV